MSSNHYGNQGVITFRIKCDLRICVEFIQLGELS